MNSLTAAKTCANIEIGDTLGGYFAKEYTNCFQIFTPDKQFYLKVYKKSNEDCEFKVCNLLTLLNEQRNSKAGSYEFAGLPDSKKENFRVAELEQRCKELEAVAGSMEVELLERRQKSDVQAYITASTEAERDFLRNVITNLTQVK